MTWELQMTGRQESTPSPTLVESTSTVGFVTDAEPAWSSEATGSVTGLDLILKKQLVSPDPENVKLMVQLDMTTDNLQENQFDDWYANNLFKNK